MTPLTIPTSEEIHPYLTEIVHATLHHTLSLLAAARDNRKFELISAVQHGADMNASRLPGGNSSLHYAVLNGNIPMAKYLIVHGTDINTRNIDGNSALHLAIQKFNKPMIFVLLANGADPRICE